MGKTRIIGDDRARLLSKIDSSGGPEACWPFTGAIGSHGYGSFYLEGKYPGAHRAAWLLLVGPIPEGFEVDHTCHNDDPTCPGGDPCLHRRCVNWGRHLRLVTHQENGHAGRTGPPVSQCLRGHAYDAKNTYWHRRKRFCRQCRRVENPGQYTRGLEFRRTEAMELRSLGLTFDQVARRLGYANRSAARNAIQLQARKTG